MSAPVTGKQSVTSSEPITDHRSPITEIHSFINFVSQHGGPRTPGLGKKLGRPKKPKKDKVAVLQITLSSPKVRTTLKRRAKAARLTPGALIERELQL